MIPSEQVDRAALGAHGEPCTQCGAPLARDQRYCLACGARRAGLSALLTDAPLEPRGRPAPAAVDPPPPPPARGFSRWSGDTNVLAGVGCLLLALMVGVLIGRAGRDPAPQRAAAPQVITLGGGAGAGPAASATASATAAPTETAAASPTATPAKAKKGAKALHDLQGTSGADYSKKSAKLPKTLTTPGAPPPKDNKAAGGGTASETFK